MPPRSVAKGYERREIDLGGVRTPAEELAEALRTAGMRQTELAERSGLTPKHINQLLRGDIAMTPAVALAIGTALGVAPEAFMFAQIQADRRRQLQSYEAWADAFDRGTLVRTGIVNSDDSSLDRTHKILELFRVASPHAFELTWIQPRTSFRRSQAYTVDSANTALWLRLLERSAEDVETPRFQPGVLRKTARRLRSLTALPLVDGFKAARELLMTAGVVLSFIREVPETRVCGATWWLSSDKAAIGVTARYRTPGSLWFNIAHEISHLLLHPRRTTFLDLDLDQAHADDAEREANEYAERLLVPAEAGPAIMAAASREELAELAARFGVGVTVIAGQHGFKTGHWSVGAPLRGQITAADIDALERASQGPTRHLAG